MRQRIVKVPCSRLALQGQVMEMIQHFKREGRSRTNHSGRIPSRSDKLITVEVAARGHAAITKNNRNSMESIGMKDDERAGEGFRIGALPAIVTYLNGQPDGVEICASPIHVVPLLMQLPSILF